MTKQIKRIKLTGMPNAAHFLFLSDVATRAEADATVSVRCGTYVAALRATVAQEDENLFLTRKSLFTDQLTAGDIERGRIYMGYKEVVRGYLKLPSEQFSEPARILNQHIKDYDIDPRMQLDRETSLFLNFLDDLEERYAPEVAALSLGPFVEGMKAANERVRTATMQRTEERMARKLGVVRKSRRAADDAFRALVGMVNALAVVEGEAPYADFIDFVNVLIVHYRREVMGRPGNNAEMIAKE